MEQILPELSSGMAPEEIVEAHPRVQIKDVCAAEAFAADYLADERAGSMAATSS